MQQPSINKHTDRAPCVSSLRSMQSLLFFPLLLLLPALNDAFLISRPPPTTRATTPHHFPQRQQYTTTTTITHSTTTTSPAGPSLRDQFFQAVTNELQRRFPNPQDITRILKFVQSCQKGTIPPTTLPYFQPSEEYVEGLTAKPWHDTKDFPWIAPLEASSSIIQEELAQVCGYV